MSTQPYEVKEVLISINNVCLDLGDRRILDGVTAEVKNIVRPGVLQGQVVGILGPSGVGKTQLSRLLAGLQPPTSGSVTVGPKNQPVEAGLVGLVPQNYPLLKHRTVLGNLMLAVKMAGHPEADVKTKAMEYLQKFNLVDKADEYPSQLSGGQRQRVAIAQQLLCSEHFIIMDEPFTGLDPLMKDKTCELIRQITLMHEENTIFVVAHDIPAVVAVADHLWLMGRTKKPDGTLGGSRIQKEYDLAAMGLAWQKDVHSMTACHDLLREIKEVFSTL
jgi:polar amino acid transport system ATP-binding protein/sulfate transport system ATP-binding protein